jgi:hypothetical protein
MGINQPPSCTPILLDRYPRLFLTWVVFALLLLSARPTSTEFDGTSSYMMQLSESNSGSSVSESFIRCCWSRGFPGISGDSIFEGRWYNLRRFGCLGAGSGEDFGADFGKSWLSRFSKRWASSTIVLGSLAWSSRGAQDSERDWRIVLMTGL